MKLHFRFGLILSLAIWEKWHSDTKTSNATSKDIENLIINMEDMATIDVHITCITTVEEARAFKMSSLEGFKKL